MLKYCEEEGKNCRERERQTERQRDRQTDRESKNINHDLSKITNIFLFFSEAFTLKTICNF